MDNNREFKISLQVLQFSTDTYLFEVIKCTCKLFGLTLCFISFLSFPDFYANVIIYSTN